MKQAVLPSFGEIFIDVIWKIVNTSFVDIRLDIEIAIQSDE